MLEVREEIFGKKDLSILNSMNNLALMLDNIGEYKEMLELKEKVLRKEYLDMLNSMNNLVNVLGNIGKYKEAEKMY
ncbi:unnamed protein product [Fusarium fujikuroi]|nr:unnamed protein product [Fusarium fujikuroi]